MLHRSLQLLVATLLFAIACPVSAQSGDWAVKSGSERDDEVVARYRQLLLRNPDQPYVLRSLLARISTGPRLDRLIASVREAAADADGTASAAAAQILLGHLYAQQDDAGRSLRSFRRATELAPRSSAAFAALGNALSEGGLKEEADAAYRRALELTGEGRGRTELLRKLLDRALAGSDLRMALRWFEPLVAASPNDFGLHVEYAETLLRARRFDDALDTYERALELAGKNGERRARLLSDIGSVHRQLEDYVAANTAYRNALRLTGRRSWMRRELMMKLVDVHRETGSLPEIYDELRREWRRPSFQNCMVLAGLAEELGRDDDAMRWLERAARLDRRAVEPRARLIARLERDGELERVEQLYREILAVRPDDLAQRLEQVEWLYFRKKEVERALDALRELERASATRPLALVEIARTWRQLGLTDESLRIHRELEQREPHHIANLETYGMLLARLGRRSAAEKVWRGLLEVDDSLRTRLRLAELTTRAGYDDWTVELLAACVEEAPELADARQRLATAYERQKQWDEAIAQWEVLFWEHRAPQAARQIVALGERTRDDALLTRWEEKYQRSATPRIGVVLMKLRRAVAGPRSDVEQLAAEIAAIDPRTLQATEYAAWIEAVDHTVDHALPDQPDRALAQLRRLAEAFGDQRARVARQMADIALTMKDDARASSVLEDAVQLATNDPYVHTQAGYHHGSNGRQTKAIEHLRRAVLLGPQGFDVHLDLVYHLLQRGENNAAREVLIDVVRSDWTGKWAVGAAFSAIDLCENDEQLFALEREVRALRGKIPQREFLNILVGIYGLLFAYADDPEVAFQKLGRAAFPILIEAVKSAGEEDRNRAVALLSLYAPTDVAAEAIRRWARESNWTPEMIWVVARCRTKSASDVLLRALDSDDEEVRRVAIFGLGYARVAQADEALVQIARNEEEYEVERSLAAVALGRIGTATADETLIELSRKHDRLGLAATWALGLSGSGRATAALVERLGEPGENRRQIASTTLARITGDAGFRALLQAYWGGNPMRRAMANRGLRIGPEALSTWNFDDQYSPIPDPMVVIRSALYDALHVDPELHLAKSFEGRSSVVVDVARDHLEDENARSVVLSDLLDIADTAGAEERPVMREIVAGLRPQLRELSAHGARTTALPATLLLPVAEAADDIAVLMNAADTFTPTDSAHVVERLGRYAWSDTREHLIDGLRSATTNRRRASLRAMRHVRIPAKQDPEALSLIESLVGDADSSVRIAAIEAIGALGHDPAVDRLVQTFEISDHQTRTAVVAALQSIDSDEARKAATQLLVDPINRPCDGDPDDLSDLLKDACVGVFDAPGF